MSLFLCCQTMTFRHFLGTCAAPPACKLEGWGVRAAWGEKTTFACLWYTSAMSLAWRCEVIKDVSNNISSHVSDQYISYHPQNDTVFQHLHGQKVQAKTHCKGLVNGWVNSFFVRVLWSVWGFSLRGLISSDDNHQLWLKFKRKHLPSAEAALYLLRKADPESKGPLRSVQTD